VCGVITAGKKQAEQKPVLSGFPDSEQQILLTANEVTS